MIQRKFLIAFISLALGTVLVTGVIGYFMGKDRMQTEVLKKLTALKETKKQQIESYFSQIEGQLKIYAASDMIVNAMEDFISAFAILEKESNLSGKDFKKYETTLQEHYENLVFAKIKKINEHEKDYLFYKPHDKTTLILQHDFLAANPHRIGSKDNLVSAGNYTYSKIHAKYHPRIKHFLKEFNFYDIFFVDINTADIVYTVYKEIDFATNLLMGPFSQSAIAKLFQKVKNDKAKKNFYFLDFEQYEPSYNMPASFIASPVFKNKKLLGVLIFQVPIDKINNIMTANNNWKKEGLGDTGETYLVCEDYSMRNNSRFLIENQENYFNTIKKTEISNNVINLIKKHNTTILFQTVFTEGVKDALSGKSGTKIMNDYRNIPVLASYAPVKYFDVNCAIIASIETSEAFSPIEDFRNWLFFLGLFLIIPTVLTSYYFSRKIAYPILKLSQAIKKITKGEIPEKILIKTNDEIESLSESFNEMIDKLNKTTVSRDYLDDILTSMTDILIIISVENSKKDAYEPKAIIEKINQSAIKSLGYKEKEIIGKPIDKICASDLDKQLFKGKSLIEILKKGKLKTEERILLRKNKEKMPVLFSATVMNRPDKINETIVCVAQDLTTYKKTQTALEKSEHILARAQRIAKLGSWEWNIVKNELSWSDEVYRIFGTEPQSFGATYDAFINFVHPDDRELVSQAVNESLNTKNPYKIEHRIIRPDGTLAIVREIGEPYYDKENKPVNMIGTVHDITDLKDTENRLTMATQVFENSIEGIMVTDEEGIILFINKAFSRITGYSADEALGQKPKILKSDNHEINFFKEMWQALQKNGSWEGEVWNRRKNGEAYPQWLTISAFQDPFGKTNRYVGIFHDLSDIKEKEAKITYHSNHDPLTGLPNKTLLLDRLQFAISQAEKQNKIMAVAILGLDRFKNINESLSHATGDNLLKIVSEKLNKAINKSDTISRIGGDEFVFILTDRKNINEIMNSIHKIAESLKKPVMLANKEIYITASIGVSIFPNDANNANKLLTFANTAISKAKKSGRNKIVMYTEAMNQLSIKNLEIETDLRIGIKADQFKMYYQPKVNIKTGKIIGAEALIRWTHPDKGFISPIDFIPIAEETDLILSIGKTVIEKTCAQIKMWQDEGYDNLNIALNLSAKQLHSPNIVEEINSVIKNIGLKPKMLGIEITESSVMADMPSAIKKLKQLKDLGITLFIDDFGTGYSSLNHLKQFPIDALKIDQSFIRNLLEEPNDAAIASAIIAMGHNLGLKIIAEGVETEEHLLFLQENKCDEMQGYLFSPPVKAEMMTEFLKEEKSISKSPY
ncbi:MAG: EAL domain-containing protein [Spirochaetia bacterium]|nr:EAL domain-containing protein [Spirochaetia bacterium]